MALKTMRNSAESNIKTYIEENSGHDFLDLNLFRANLKELRNYCDETGINFEKLCNDYINRESSDDWYIEEKIHEIESDELIQDYYSITKMYLIELTIQESSLNYRNLFCSIANFAKRRNIERVLDYGGGVGGLALYLSKKGIHCDYADIVGKTWDYARYRFNKQGLDVAQYTEKTLNKTSDNYDLIVSLDCLEHLKNLPRYIALFNTALKTNGLLLVKSTFRGRGVHLFSNHKYNGFETFNKMMGEKGFVFKGQLITRLKRNFMVPVSVLKLLKPRPVSGRKLIYIKNRR